MTIQKWKYLSSEVRGERLSLAMRLIVFICISLTSCLFPLSSASQTLTGSAPSHVAVGEQFRLTYTVNTQNATDFRAGDIPGELEVLIGPNRSMQSSYQMINGHTSSSVARLRQVQVQVDPLVSVVRTNKGKSVMRAVRFPVPTFSSRSVPTRNASMNRSPSFLLIRYIPLWD